MIKRFLEQILMFFMIYFGLFGGALYVIGASIKSIYIITVVWLASLIVNLVARFKCYKSGKEFRYVFEKVNKESTVVISIVLIYLLNNKFFYLNIYTVVALILSLFCLRNIYLKRYEAEILVFYSKGYDSGEPYYKSIKFDASNSFKPLYRVMVNLNNRLTKLFPFAVALGGIISSTNSNLSVGVYIMELCWLVLLVYFSFHLSSFFFLKMNNIENKIKKNKMVR